MIYVIKLFTRVLLYVSIFCLKFLATISQRTVDSVLPRCSAYMQGGLKSRAVCRLCVSLSIHLSSVNCDKTKETSAHIIIPYERSKHIFLRHKEWLVGDVPFYMKIGKLTHPFKDCDFQSIRSIASIMTNRKSTTRILRSLRWTAYVALKQEGGQKF